MSEVHLDRRDPTVDAIVRAAFPTYNGKRVSAIITPSCHFSGTMWSEGARRSYVLLRLSDMAHQVVPREQFMERSAAHEEPFPIPDGMVVVCYNQGYYDHITIFSPSENITKALDAPVDLAQDERIVLVATRSLKPSYGGVSNFRFHEARRYTMITLDRWEAAKASCIAKGWLNKAGAITITGRNLVPFPMDLFRLTHPEPTPCPAVS